MAEKKNTEEMEEIEETLSEDYSCPSCGAPIQFDPDSSSLLCKYCGFSQKLDGQSSDEEYELDNVEENNEWQNETKIIKCENCAAENVVDKNAITSTCPFCGSNQVVETNEIVGIKPQRVIPFKLNETDAKETYNKWIKKRFFSPSKIKKQKVSTVINGVYLPVWTFDANSLSKYNGRLGKYYTVVRGSGKNQRVETRIRWFRIHGIKNLLFDDLTVNAGVKITQGEIDKLAPYQTNDSFIYEKNYLVGFAAEHYYLKLSQGWDTAKTIAEPIIRQKILDNYHYDVVGSLKITTNYSNITYKYVLIPVWIGNYTYNNKNYRYLVNGETGKLVGKAPTSVLKVLGVTFAIIVLAVAVLLLCYFSGQF